MSAIGGKADIGQALFGQLAQDARTAGMLHSQERWVCHRLFGWLVAPKTLEPRRRQLCVAHRVLDRLVSQIALDRARIDALIGQLVTASMAQSSRRHALALPIRLERILTDGEIRLLGLQPGEVKLYAT